MGALAGFGKPKSKREPVDVAEPKPQDKTLDKLLGVRKQRLDRLERERKDSRDAWKAARAEFREKKLQWRAAIEDAKKYWVQARKDFLSMTTTSGQYQKSKAVYERMKQAATDQRVMCLESLEKCKSWRSEFFAARERVLTANRQQEKLTIMRDELRRANQQEDT
jgi:hypothetical protein